MFDKAKNPMTLELYGPKDKPRWNLGGPGGSPPFTDHMELDIICPLSIEDAEANGMTVETEMDWKKYTEWRKKRMIRDALKFAVNYTKTGTESSTNFYLEDDKGVKPEDFTCDAVQGLKRKIKVNKP
jgi:hypothetical protein